MNDEIPCNKHSKTAERSAGVIFYTIPGLDSSKMLRSNMIEKG